MKERVYKMLKVENLSVNVKDEEILHGVNLEILAGETHALLGPNGSGKTTLLLTIMGMPDYQVTEGRILFEGRDITKLSIDDRAKLGIGVSFQKPPFIRGVTTHQMIEIVSKGKADIEELAFFMRLNDFLDRDINYGFSGGEVKRSELMQLLAQDPKLALIDEPESGVDLESISLIGGAINRLLNKDHRLKERRSMPKKAGLIITHTGHILDFVNIDKAHVIVKGNIGCTGLPQELLNSIRKLGYEECVRCQLERR